MRLPAGVRRHGRGFQTFCRVNGEFRCATWAKDTLISEMTAWLRDQRKDRLPQRVTRGTFDGDVETYLERVAALVTMKQRTQHLALWRQVFTGRRRRSITSAEIRGQRDAWLTAGLAPHTVNLRLRALSNLWTVLDGRRAPNPVREVPEAQEPSPEPRAVPYGLVQTVVEAFRDPLASAIGHLMLSTGLAPVEIMRLRVQDWSPRDQTLFVQGRKKGAGGAARVIPLSHAGTRAIQAFSAAHGWGQPIGKRFYRQFARAKRYAAADPDRSPHEAQQLLRLRVYDLRHSYLTELYRESGDAHAAAYLAGHRSKSTTDRYIAAAVLERARRAVTTVKAGNSAGTVSPRRPGNHKDRPGLRPSTRMGANSKKRGGNARKSR